MHSLSPLIVLLALLTVLSTGAPTTPPLLYFSQWSAALNWTYVSDDGSAEYYSLSVYYDYTGSLLRLDSTNDNDATLPNGANGASSELYVNQQIYSFNEQAEKFCTVQKSDSPIDPFYPFKDAKYVGFGMTPEVNRLGVHYTNVSFANLFINADLWVDPYTGWYLYAAPSADQDIGFFIFDEFNPDSQPSELFTLPSFISSTCQAIN